MKFHYLLRTSIVAMFFILFASPLWSQDSLQTTKKKSKDKRLMFQLSDQDIILPITSIEWGTPDRWSVTSRYVHWFEKDRGNKTWLSGLTITLSLYIIK